MGIEKKSLRCTILDGRYLPKYGTVPNNLEIEKILFRIRIKLLLLNCYLCIRLVLASLNKWFADKLESQPDATEIILANCSDETTKGGPVLTYIRGVKEIIMVA